MDEILSYYITWIFYTCSEDPVIIITILDKSVWLFLTLMHSLECKISGWLLPLMSVQRFAREGSHADCLQSTFFFFLSFRSFWDIQFDSIFLSVWGHFCHIFVAQRLFLREQRENDWTFLETVLYRVVKIIKLIRYFKNYWIWTKIKPRQLPYLGKVQKCIQGVSAWTLLMGVWGSARVCLQQ